MASPKHSPQGQAARAGKRSRDVATLAIDIGGTGLKATVLDREGAMLSERVRVETPDPAPPEVMVDALIELVAPLPGFKRVSVGFPGVVRDGRVITAPHFGNDSWKGFALADTLAEKLGAPVRLLNDAEVQGYGVICGSGLEFVITLGTGLGTALFRDGELMPHMEFAQFPGFKKDTLNQYVGDEIRRRIGRKKWNHRIEKVVQAFRTLLNFDQLYLGGGNATKLDIRLPQDVKIVSNDAGLTGGVRLWDQALPAAGARHGPD